MKAPAYFAWGIVLLLAGCSETREPETPTLLKFNKLIDTQIELLSQNNYALDKLAAIDTNRFHKAFVPNREGWRRELDIFRQIELINKPIHRKSYRSIGPLKDDKSNLQIHQYMSASSPLVMLRIYFQDEVGKMKRIEAIITESNLLYGSSKSLMLEFEEVAGAPLLSMYSIDGFQKVILRDTVTFHLKGQISN